MLVNLLLRLAMRALIDRDIKAQMALLGIGAAMIAAVVGVVRLV